MNINRKDLYTLILVCSVPSRSSGSVDWYSGFVCGDKLSVLLHFLFYFILHGKYIAVFGKFLYFKILLKYRYQLFGLRFTGDSNHLFFPLRKGSVFGVSVLLSKRWFYIYLPLVFLTSRKGWVCLDISTYLVLWTDFFGVEVLSLSVVNTFGFFFPLVDAGQKYFFLILYQSIKDSSVFGFT